MEESGNSVQAQEAITAPASEHVQESASQSAQVDNRVASSPVESEKMFTQDEVNKLVGSVKHKERERAGNVAPNNQDYSQPSEAGNQSQAVPQGFDVRKEVEKTLHDHWQAAEQQRAMKEAEDIIREVDQKVESEAKDLDGADLSFYKQSPEMYLALKSIDNPAHVLNSLEKDFVRRQAIISGLRSTDESDRNAAVYEVKKISDKLRNDQKANNLHNRGNVPSKIKSSPVNTGNARPSHSEMRNNPAYKW